MDWHSRERPGGTEAYNTVTEKGEIIRYAATVGHPDRIFSAASAGDSSVRFGQQVLNGFCHLFLRRI